MADARPLFYVTAVVIAALAAWVASVWLRKLPSWADPPPPLPPVPLPPAQPTNDAKSDDATK